MSQINKLQIKFKSDESAWHKDGKNISASGFSLTLKSAYVLWYQFSFNFY